MNSDELFEMSNFGWRTTGLPSDINVWTRTDPEYHGHDRYRIKVTKSRRWAGIFTVGRDPKLVKNINDTLSVQDREQIINWIRDYYPLIISHIDGSIDSAEFAFEIQKIRGSL
jgi:hypothetical protein